MIQCSGQMKESVIWCITTPLIGQSPKKKESRRRKDRNYEDVYRRGKCCSGRTKKERKAHHTSQIGSAKGNDLSNQSGTVWMCYVRGEGGWETKYRGMAGGWWVETKTKRVRLNRMWLMGEAASGLVCTVELVSADEEMFIVSHRRLG